ncbi:Stp1/IreP family PP2C-type Ser/Thr phosphatase [Youngiibacter fragilis]|uniref:Protein phosphatase n=1 Tax=Youngiibacter fragilis 232.1 TaxID=994573 RepID=V7I746_9CLOT|nr:Stp1/IreP family PP2C-type Ser/Thr phosphatase [Youngiibacter fragilis]ETA82040.1 protein phosphatase [Youngiibacter fragilis 232.1]
MVDLISDIGNIRKLNEDSAGWLEGNGFALFVVCDGMGGHNAGEVASEMAMKTIKDAFTDGLSALPDQQLKMAVESANRAIYRMSANDKHLKGMGTTVSAVLSEHGRIHVAHVGDSSVYRIREHSIVKLTKDHSLVQTLVDMGTITAEEAKHHHNKNIITRAVGTNEEVEVDMHTLVSDPYDIYLLCTDGLTDYISEEEILEVSEKGENGNSLRHLVTMAKERGGKDNITLLVFGGEAVK